MVKIISGIWTKALVLISASAIILIATAALGFQICMAQGNAQFSLEMTERFMPSYNTSTYNNGYEGLDVSVAAVLYEGILFCDKDLEYKDCADSTVLEKIRQSGGELFINHHQLVLDPDAVGRGKPTLEVTLTRASSFFPEESSLSRLMEREMPGTIRLPSLFSKTFGNRPFKSYTLRVTSEDSVRASTYQRVDLWLRLFEVSIKADFREEPTGVSKGDYDKTRTITGQLVGNLPDEKGERFEPLVIFLRVRAKSAGRWDHGYNGFIESDPELRFNIPALDVLSLCIFDDKNNQDACKEGQSDKLKLSVNQGAPLSFISSLADRPVSVYNNPVSHDSLTDKSLLSAETRGKWDISSFVGDPKAVPARLTLDEVFVPIRVGSIGSWEKRGLARRVSGTTRAKGDQAHFTVLVHLLSSGNWSLKQPDRFVEFLRRGTSEDPGRTLKLWRAIKDGFGAIWPGSLFGRITSIIVLVITAATFIPRVAGALGLAIGKLISGIRTGLRTGRRDTSAS